MKLNPDFIPRELMDDFLLLPSGQAALAFNGIITLNEMGRDIFQLLPQVEHEEALTQRLLEEYDVGEEELRADLSEFLSQLRERNILLD